MKAYSYIRFSSGRQHRGMSLDRQLESATRYAQSHGLVLDTSTYRDLGVSAFKSKNVDAALGAFIKAVESGVVVKGSYLLVENLDRLSRDTVRVAMERFLQITRLGVVIVTLQDEQVYSSANIDDNWTKLIIAMAVMARANEESATKSKRSLAAKVKRHARGDYSAPHPPFWLDYDSERTKFELKPEPTAVVRRIFRMALNGGGARAIARTLNTEKVPVFTKSKEWTQIQVSRILAMPAAMGAARLNTKTSTPTIKEGVYPPVVTKEEFERVRSLVLGRHTVRGSTVSRDDNIFGGLSFCGYCGERMRFHPRKDNLRWYMKCTKHADGVGKPCFKKMFQYHGCEDALIYELTHHGRTAVGADYFAGQSDRRTELTRRIEELRARQAKLVQLSALAEVEAVADELNRVQAEVIAKQGELALLSPYGLSDQEIHDSASMYDEYARFTNQLLQDWNPRPRLAKNIIDLRVRVKGLLTRTVKRIDFASTSKKEWEPILNITYISGVVSKVKVKPSPLHPPVGHKRPKVRRKNG